MFKLKSLVLAAILAVSGLTILAGETAQAEDKYGAIAYSQRTGAWGWSYGFESQEEAEERAVFYAKDATAKPIVWGRNDFYIALAVGDDVSAYGYGYASTAAEAKLIALQEANKRTTGARVVICVHATDGKVP